MTESDAREKARALADSVIIDAALTFAALCHESGLHGHNFGEYVIDEWASALQESAQTAREQVEEIRAHGVAAILAQPVEPEDAMITELLRERRRDIREHMEIANGQEPPVIDG